MPFPESEREIYRNNPLVEVICQLKFPTILEIESERPAKYQRSIRAQYPLYEKEIPGIGGVLDRIPKEIAQLFAAGLQASNSGGDVIHKFISEDSLRIIALQSSFVAFTDKRYQEWQDFRENIRLAQDSLEELHKPAFYSRIGLRYRDVIDREKLNLQDRAWSELFRPEFLGLLGAEAVGDEITNTRTDMRFEIEGVVGGFANLRHGFVESDGEIGDAYLIDVDFFTNERSEREDVYRTLDEFNRLSGNLFRWAITPALREALGP